jgi:hypothetical protein
MVFGFVTSPPQKKSVVLWMTLPGINPQPRAKRAMAAQGR